jgi:hypothetical protein
MAKVRCMCGHIIVDQTDNIPYKGYILPDVHVDKVSDNMTSNIDSLIDATKKGERLEWIENHFKVPPYPTDLKESSMIYDSLSLNEVVQEIFECQNCGRIAIEIGQTNMFKFFKPESDDTKGVLNGGNE